MRTKPNKHKSNSEDSHWEHNDLFRKFQREFDVLLQGDSPCLNKGIVNECYVENKIIEDKIRYLLKSSTDTIQFLIGRTGIGKSTVIRYIFNTSRRPVLEDGAIIIPFSFNGMALDESDCKPKLSAVISASSKIIANFFKIKFDRDEFLRFIESHAPDVLLRGSVDIDASDREILESFKNEAPYSYALEQFKYVLDKSPIDRVIVLVDDIESESQVVQEEIIERMCRLHTCLRNYSNKKAYINLLFSVRPVTEKLARKNKAINAFPISRAIILKKPIPLDDLFKSRMKFASKEAGNDHVNSLESWDSALEVLLMIVSQISDKFGYGLMRLFNNNIRRTLIEFQMLITNRIWLQRAQQPQAAFKVRLENFSITGASVCKALGMRNTYIYPSEGTCVVNIFKNKSEDTYDLLIIYIILFMLERNGDNEYLDGLIDKEELIEIFKQIFSINNYEAVINRTIADMQEMRLLEIEEPTHKEKGTEFLVLQPRASQIWNMLGNTSVLLEMFRDDTFQNFNNRSKKLSSSFKADERIEENFEFLSQIYAWEKIYIKSFKLNNISLASKVFGSETIYSHMLSGVRDSLYAYYHELDELPDNVKDLLTRALDKSQNLSY